MWLNALPLWQSGLLIVILPTLLAAAGTAFVRRRMRLSWLAANNEVAGFKFAVVGVIYAVLLAFAIIVVWEELNDAEADVAREAGAATNLYRLAAGIEGEPGLAIRRLVTRYLETAIAEEWPAMARGGSSPAANRALTAIYAGVVAYRPADMREQAVMSEMLGQLSALTQARRERLVKASALVPGIIWAALIVGAVVTIGFTYFFGSRDLRAQMLMTGALTLLICTGLLVILAIDHPFNGGVRVEPEALVKVLEDFAHEPPPAR
ncbi:MAG TPA: hypothetical protein VF304_16930 [Casimicrobiaceae bacterium]